MLSKLGMFDSYFIKQALGDSFRVDEYYRILYK